MSHYRQSLLLEASPATVFSALTTPEGLRGWWTQTCEAATVVGGTTRVRFGHTHKDLRIEGLEPDREVSWRCTGARLVAPKVTRLDEWVGTRITFRLSSSGRKGQTRLEFEHVGLVPEFECYELCTGGWRQFLGSLRQFVETGQGAPYAPAAGEAPEIPETRSERA